VKEEGIIPPGPPRSHVRVFLYIQRLRRGPTVKPRLPRNGPGELQVGLNDQGTEIIINLPKDMTGHIVFSLPQAANLAKILMKKIKEVTENER
jgi:hypothetical protein